MNKYEKKTQTAVLSLFFFLAGAHLRHMEVPGRGVELELRCLPTPQPQEYQIWATSMSSNAGSVTHWVRPGVELMASWILVQFLSCWATMRTPDWGSLLAQRVKYQPMSLHTAAQVAAVAWVQTSAQELLYAKGLAKNKKKERGKAKLSSFRHSLGPEDWNHLPPTSFRICVDVS